jgi:hypothetical protein
MFLLLILRSLVHTGAMAGIDLAERCWERKPSAVPKSKSPSRPHHRPQGTHQPLVGSSALWYWENVFHRCSHASWPGERTTSACTTYLDIYLTSWALRLLLRFGFLVQLLSFCPIILRIETSSALGKSCFVTPVKNNSHTRKHFVTSVKDRGHTRKHFTSLLHLQVRHRSTSYFLSIFQKSPTLPGDS